VSQPEHVHRTASAGRAERQASVEHAPAVAGPAVAPAFVRDLLALQATAGNRAVLQLLGHDGASPPRFDPPPGALALRSGAWQFGRHPQFPGTMGQTWYAHNDIEMWPSFRIEPSRSWIPPFDYQAKPRATDAVGAAWPVVATPENEGGYKMPYEHPKYPGRELIIRVSSTAANNIAFAEQQHVDDLDDGWSLTGLAARDAINKAAGEDWSEGDDRAAAKRAAIDKVVGYMGGLGPLIRGGLEEGGSLEPSLGPIMDAAFTQTRAKRDTSGKHTIPVVYVFDTSEMVLFEADEDHPNDSQSTSEVVNLGTIGGG